MYAQIFWQEGVHGKKLETIGLWNYVYAVEDQGLKWGFGCSKKKDRCEKDFR